MYLEDDARLLLRVATAPPEEALRAWREWRAGGGHIETLERDLAQLLPQIARRLPTLEAEDPALGKVRGAFRHTWSSNQWFLRAATRGLVILQDAGLDTLLIKGGALVGLHPAHVGLRPMADLDVLVRPADFVRAANALRDAGWPPGWTMPLDEMARVRHSIGFTGPDGIELDLHISSLWEPGSDEAMWRSARPVTLAGVPTLAPSPSHQLFVACGHAVSPGASSTRWVADVALLLHGDEPIDWNEVIAAARDRRMTAGVADALALLRDSVGLAIPGDVIAALEDSPGTARERRLARMRAIRPRQLGHLALWRDHFQRLRRRPFAPDTPPRDFPEYLRLIWDLPSRRALPAEGVRRALRASR